jgi:hypothetical protein
MHYLDKIAAPVPKGMKALQKPAILGAITHTPTAQAAQEAAAAQKAKQSIASEESSKDAKEGDLMAMADGGESHVYKPTYTNYQQTPYDIQRAMQSYGQQMPAELPQSMPAVGSQGYKIDPLLMQGSPAYNAEQARLAAEEAERQAQLIPYDSGPSWNGSSAKAGGLMGHAMGGHLGGYSDGGRLLRGPGDGVSDSIPATIGGRQPARLAEGEFVIPARIVSELGNGSTDAGAKRLYAMMDRIKAKRAKTKNIAKDTKAYKYLPA